MFETQMVSDLKAIFEFDKVTFEAPSDSEEQECLFINVENTVFSVKPGHEYARVSGRLVVYANSQKLPFGYFYKQIDKADTDISSRFAFFEFEENAWRYRNICERSVRFVYFLNKQYDPEQGSITSINLQEASE
jgi:hypothetical protein